MNTEPRWLSAAAVVRIHSEQLARFGGGDGLRDAGLLASALARPRQIAQYEPSADLFQLAAALAFSLIRNHPFIDGNKRVGLIAFVAFLAINGWELETTNADAFETILAAAAGERTESQLEAWARAHARPAE